MISRKAKTTAVKRRRERIERIYTFPGKAAKMGGDGAFLQI